MRNSHTTTPVAHRLGAVTASLLSCIAFAQEPAAHGAADAEQRYLDLIAVHEEQGGLTAPELVEPLTTLGLHYLEAEDYDRAAETLEQARQVMRVNAGFGSLAEAQLLSHLVRAEEGRRNVEAAWNLEQTLLDMAAQRVGELDTVPMFRTVADKRLELLQVYRKGDVPPQIVLGCYYGMRGYPDQVLLADILNTSFPSLRMHCSSGDSDVVITGLLMEARIYHTLALEALIKHDLFTSAEAQVLLTDILRTTYILQARRPQYTDPMFDLVTNRVLGYAPKDTAGIVRRAHALIQFADMHLIREHRARRYTDYEPIFAQYEQAYAELQAAGVSQGALDELFAPALPVVLPAFTHNPLETEEGTHGYVDVSFVIEQGGKSDAIDVTGMSDGVRRGQRRKVTRMIELESFRPRLREGRVVEESAISLRYYLDAGSE